MRLVKLEISMEHLQNHFNRIARQNPNLSSLVCFYMTMKTRKYSQKVITDGFNKLVEKGDYPRKHYDELLGQVLALNLA